MVDGFRHSSCHELAVFKTIEVSIEQASWPPSGTPAFPPAFHSGTQTLNIDVSSTLLLIGLLTTPTVRAGVSMSELWAWVRYYYAVAATSELRLTRDFSELDSHQKTILSDDFGMGFPISWLLRPLDLVAFCDGREFTDRFSALTVPLAAAPKKRGPAKSPDFVFLDGSGRFHVVECKGTQSGPRARDKQMSDTTAKGEPNGAIVQKRMIVIQPGYQGQNLACGLTIERDDSPRTSSLLIVDPEGEEKVMVKESDMIFARDPVIRASTARALRAAGFPISASVIASPSGRRQDARADTRPIARRRERVREEFTAARRDRAIAEIRERVGTQKFNRAESDYVGRVVDLSLPKPLAIGDTIYTHVVIRQGVRRDFLEDLLSGALEDMPIEEAAPGVRARFDGFKLLGEGSFAELEFGTVFASDLRLK